MSSHKLYSKQKLHLRAAEYFHQQRPPKSAWTSLQYIEVILSEYDHLVRGGAFDEALDVIEEIDGFYLSKWGYTKRIFDMRYRLLKQILDPHRNIQNLLGLGRVSIALGKSELAKQYLTDALYISKQHQLEMEYGIALSNLAQALFDSGDYDKAINYYWESISITRKVPYDPRGEAARLCGLAVVFREKGELVNAAECLNNGILAIDKIAPAGRSILGSIYKNLGDIDCLMGRYENAKKRFRKALLISKEEIRRSPRAEHEALSGLASILEDSGNYDWALKQMKQALDIAVQIQEKDTEGYIQRNIGRVHVLLGNSQDGIRLLENALNISRALRLPRLKHYTACDISVAHLFQNNIELADLAMKVANEYIVPRNSAFFYLLQGITFSKLNRPTDAIEAFNNAISSSKSLLKLSPDYYQLYYVKAFSISAIMLLRNQQYKYYEQGLTAYYQDALTSCNAKGVVTFFRRLLNSIEPFDKPHLLDEPISLLEKHLMNKEGSAATDRHRS